MGRRLPKLEKNVDLVFVRFCTTEQSHECVNLQRKVFFGAETLNT